MLFVCPAVKSVRDRPSYFAEKLYKSMKGAGTDERTLTRVMVTRSEIDMVQIKQRFQEHYGKTLASFIKVKYLCRCLVLQDCSNQISRGQVEINGLCGCGTCFMCACARDLGACSSRKILDF